MQAKRDENRVTTLLGVSSVDGVTPVTLYANPITHALLASVPGGAGTVTSVSVTTANGVSGVVATATTTPAITLTLGDITPSKVNGNIITAGTGTLTLGTNTLTVSGTANVSGTNSGDNAANTSCLALDQTTPQSVIGTGRPTFTQGLKLGLTPTVGVFAEGKTYYDANWKTIAADIGRDVTLQVGQEELRRVYNDTGAILLQGKAVYTNGVRTDGTLSCASVALAQANAESTSTALGITTQDIPVASYGFITVRGHVDLMRTDYATWTASDILYLSSTTAGELQNTIPTGTDYKVRMGRLIIVSTNGTVTVSSATPAVVSWATHGLAIGDPVSFTSTIALPTGILPDVEYYVMTAGYGANAFQIELVKGSGIAINTTDTGVGTITCHKHNGRMNVRLIQIGTLGGLSDVTLATPALDQVLTFNGSEWVNGQSATSSASTGISFFNATPVIKARTAPAGLNQAGTAGNGIQINSLSKTPITTAEQTQTMLANNDTRAGSSWIYDTALGRTSIDAGLWSFTTYASVSSLTGTNTITRTIYQVVPGTGTLDFTGAGDNSRTATITDAQYDGTYFAASATNTTASWIQATSGTDKGMYQITAMTDAGKKIATVTVGTGYTNETGVTYNIWNKLFSITTEDLTSTSLSEYNTIIAQPAFTVAATDKLGGMMFVTASSSADRTFTVAYNGTLRNSHISTPLITLHNNLAGLQGGSATERYHLTSAQHTIATQAANTTVSGYLATADWDTFNDKQSALVNSAGLAGAVNDETGTGVVVFNNSPTFLDDITIGTAGTASGKIILKGTTSGTVNLQVAAAAGSYTLTLPTDDGTASQYLQTDGSGVLTWATPSGGGADILQTQVFF